MLNPIAELLTYLLVGILAIGYGLHSIFDHGRSRGVFFVIPGIIVLLFALSGIWGVMFG